MIEKISGIQDWIDIILKIVAAKNYDHARLNVMVYGSDEHRPFLVSLSYQGMDKHGNEDTVWKSFQGVTFDEAAQNCQNWLATLDDKQTAQWRSRINALADIRDELRIADLDDAADAIERIIAPIRTNLLPPPSVEMTRVDRAEHMDEGEKHGE